jgi:hypothetical protein
MEAPESEKANCEPTNQDFRIQACFPAGKLGGIDAAAELGALGWYDWPATLG